MASPALFRSTASPFHGPSPALSAPIPTAAAASWLGYPSARIGFAPRASATVLVEKSESETPNRLKTIYRDRIVPLLKEEFSYHNIHQVPKIEKVVVNCGMGDASQNKKGFEAAVTDLACITGQKPIVTRARVAIAAFKLRKNDPVGLAVTLRGNVMYSFLDRLINLGLPRTRDFQGVNPNSFDGSGNYSIGMREQGVFPEIKFDLLGRVRGMDVCITTTANTDKEAQRLLALMGMPYKEGEGPTVTVRKKKLKAHHFASKSKGRAKSR